MGNCSEEKKELVEKIGLHFEKEYNLAPLAARIFGLLILSPTDEFTFDEITQITCASKSSVSTNINFLLQLKNIEYFTKPGDRKRYFKISKNHLQISLGENLHKINKDIEMINLIDDYNCQFEENQSHKHQVRTIYKAYLKNQQENLTNTINKIKTIDNL